MHSAHFGPSLTAVDVRQGALVRTTGPAEAPVLLLIHAFAETGSCFAATARCGLDQRFRLVVPDLWGFGATPWRPSMRTVADYARALRALVADCIGDRPVGLVAHSIASAMAIELVELLGPQADQVVGVFSIEGNLTVHDAMFTGRANSFETPEAFKASFLDEIWEMGRTMPALRHYFATAHMADPRAMWHLGRDTTKISRDNRLAERFQALKPPALYYWSEQSTPGETQAWIRGADISHQVYTGAGHWPMIDCPQQTCKAIIRFFDRYHSPG